MYAGIQNYYLGSRDLFPILSYSTDHLLLLITIPNPNSWTSEPVS